MRTIWHSLAWKEWNEHKWKLVSILGVIWSLLLVMVLIDQAEHRLSSESLFAALLLGGIPMAIFVGLSAAAGERSRGTLTFLQALPVPLWRIALHKLGFALLSLVVPIGITSLIVVGIQVIFPTGLLAIYRYVPPHSIQEWQWLWSSWLGVVAILATGNLVIWAAACGNNRKDEVSAGAVALVLMTVWWSIVLFFWLALLKGTHDPDTARLRVVGVASAPLGFLGIPEVADRIDGCFLLGCATFILVNAWLAARYVTRFGRADDYANRSPRAAINKLYQSEFLGRPHRFGVTAIAWKQLRESSPIALAGLAATVMIAACFTLGGWYVGEHWLQNAGKTYALTAVSFGFFIALVAGISVALQDVGSSLNTFWRSRPIQPDLWLWTKFATALVVVLAVIYVPIGLFFAFGEKSVSDVMPPLSWANVLAAQVAVFAAAAMMTCLVRQAVYAAILGVALVYLGIAIYHIAWMVASHFGLTGSAPYQWRQITPDQMLGGLCATATMFTVVAWLAMRNDWGWASRN